MTLTLPTHPLLTTPNRITAADFEGWVQERGLYFAGTWDPRYETPLSMARSRRGRAKGGLADLRRHGKGDVRLHRALLLPPAARPACPGAYRLFVNLVSGGR